MVGRSMETTLSAYISVATVKCMRCPQFDATRWISVCSPLNLLDDFDRRWLYIVCFIISAVDIVQMFDGKWIFDPMRRYDEEWMLKFAWLSGNVMDSWWHRCIMTGTITTSLAAQLQLFRSLRHTCVRMISSLSMTVIVILRFIVTTCSEFARS
jgi:hypothetical protein